MKKTLATLALALIGSLMMVAPAEAHDGPIGEHILGHRCRTYDTKVTNEDTVAALRDTAEIPGAICEIDAIRIADGTVVVIHDGTWKRTADPASLKRAGVSPTSQVKRARWSQVSKIRTKGGEPIPRLEDMIDAAAQYDIPLIVDVRNAFPQTQTNNLVKYATDRGADVRYYQLLQGNCTSTVINRFRTAGAKVGVKLLGECPMTADQMAALGATFTQQVSWFLSDTFLVRAKELGIEVGVLDRGMTEARAQSLYARGVMRFLLDRPKEALGWNL
jgi:glycerophosphoryl diester phosphodiesterase